jgi:hypothetical protein
MSSNKHDNSTIMSYDDLIKQWFEKSLSPENDIFTTFIFLYFSFIAYLRQEVQGTNDYARICSLKRLQGVRDYYLHLVQDDGNLETIIKELISELGKRSLVNVTDRGTGTNFVIRDEEDWENLVEYWYRIRNNLFHARKGPEIERDKRLIQYANLTLIPLMKYFVGMKHL